jgi:hypothetical protein
MRRPLSHIRQNAVAYLALFVALGGTSAYAANTIATGDIVDNQVTTADVRNDNLGFGGLYAADLGAKSVGSSEVSDGTLEDEDIAQAGGVNVHFLGTIGLVPAHNCIVRTITGANAQGDHLVLTPNAETASQLLTYTATYSSAGGDVYISACNPTNADVDDGTTRFNLLEIDAN